MSRDAPQIRIFTSMRARGGGVGFVQAEGSRSGSRVGPGSGVAVGDGVGAAARVVGTTAVEVCGEEAPPQAPVAATRRSALPPVALVTGRSAPRRLPDPRSPRAFRARRSAQGCVSRRLSQECQGNGRTARSYGITTAPQIPFCAQASKVPEP